MVVEGIKKPTITSNGNLGKIYEKQSCGNWKELNNNELYTDEFIQHDIKFGYLKEKLK